MMRFLGNFLIVAGDFILALWAWMKLLFGWIATTLDFILNPILAPLLRVVNPICRGVGDLSFALLAPLPTWLGLTLVSILLGVVMLLAFRRLSNQAAIGRAKDDIKAHLLAMKLFRDDLRVVFLSQLRLLYATVRLQRYMFAPLLWSLFPMMLILSQMGLRYQWRPLRVGERTIVKLRTATIGSVPSDVVMQADENVDVEVGPVPGGGEWVWRIRAVKEGRHTLGFRTVGSAATEVSKELVVSDGPGRVSALRPGSHWLDQLLHPTETPFRSDSPVGSIEIAYPSVPSYVYGADYWVVYFFVVSMITALLLAPVFRVKF